MQTSLFTKSFFPDHVVTGAGSDHYWKNDDLVEYNANLGMKLDYFYEDGMGFSYFVVKKDEITVKFVNENACVMHTFSRKRNQNRRLDQFLYKWIFPSELQIHVEFDRSPF